MLRNRIGEGLAVAGAAVEIDHHHRIALPGVGLRVPAVAPAIAEAALRPAMDQERDRILLARLVVPRLHHVAVHGLVVPALNENCSKSPQATSWQHVAGAGRDRALRLPSGAAEKITSPVFIVLRANASVRTGERRRRRCRRRPTASPCRRCRPRTADACQDPRAVVVDRLAIGGQRDAVGGERSHFGDFAALPLARSIAISAKRSASKPGTFIAR